jgi:hypothetical protein
MDHQVHIPALEPNKTIYLRTLRSEYWVLTTIVSRSCEVFATVYKRENNEDGCTSLGTLKLSLLFTVNEKFIFYDKLDQPYIVIVSLEMGVTDFLSIPDQLNSNKQDTFHRKE